MATVLPEVPLEISAYFDDDNPLGPVAAEYISDQTVAAYLINLDNDAYVDLFKGSTILFGRKGAGKSSILNSFLFPSAIRSRSGPCLGTPTPIGASASKALQGFGSQYSLIVRINASREIGAVVDQVNESGFPRPELAAEIWTKHLWANAIRCLADRADLSQKLSPVLQGDLLRIASYAHTPTARQKRGRFFEEWQKIGELSVPSADELINNVRSELATSGVNTLFLIDTIEEYPFSYNEALKKTVGGLLYLVAEQNNNVAYKVAFPYEIYDIVRLEGNPEKYTLKTAHLKWSPRQLIQIVTRRMLLCLYLFENESLADSLRKHRDDSADQASFMFWDKFFGGKVLNEAHHQEPGLHYVLRHTQLLPRQVINSLSRIVSLSKIDLRSYSVFDPKIINDSMRSSCSDLVGGVESGFRYTYPDLGSALEAFLSRANIVATYRELHSVYSNSSISALGGVEDYTKSFDQFLKALLHMGIYGIVSDTGTQNYINAVFSYNDEKVLRGFYGKTYAMHPAFSMIYKGDEERLNVGRAILPFGTVEHP